MNDSVARSSELNPDSLATDELAIQLGPFGSWPKGGSRPAGFFSSGKLEGADRFYREQGYLVVENALSSTEVEELKAETRKLCRNEDGAIDGVAPVSKEITYGMLLMRMLRDERFAWMPRYSAICSGAEAR